MHNRFECLQQSDASDSDEQSVSTNEMAEKELMMEDDDFPEKFSLKVRNTFLQYEFTNGETEVEVNSEPPPKPDPFRYLRQCDKSDSGEQVVPIDRVAETEPMMHHEVTDVTGMGTKSQPPEIEFTNGETEVEVNSEPPPKPDPFRYLRQCDKSDSGEQVVPIDRVAETEPMMHHEVTDVTGMGTKSQPPEPLPGQEEWCPEPPAAAASGSQRRPPDEQRTTLMLRNLPS
eukprot:CAMPEP_0172932920 /NCGR_PEP_ID=MMETSP1075-20121228/220243_1 /TAXON_ID=2916 /ORGANISM="Ceratium fusus, Strain PA161109" /LENGTH=229 /DNA_ID=CAMNT_0013794255 /DNA_START=17 /DNA_END=704 /DNA_ORIENTATION=+